jgi:DNA ligase (NAD+)
VGEKAAFVLAKQFKAMDDLSGAGLEDLDTIYEVGPVMAESIVDYFSQPGTKELIAGLKKAGLELKEEILELKPTGLTGKTVVFTGELKDYSRPEAEDLVRKSGGNASASVGKNADFVVAGENPGSKYAKAVKLGVKIINEDEFREMIK